MERMQLLFSAQRRLSHMMKMTTRCCRTIAKQQAVAVIFERTGFFSDSAKPEISEDVPYPLTKEEALFFVKTRLKIPDPEVQSARDRLKFLNHMADQLNKNIPFTNMHYFLATPIWEMDEHVQKQNMLSGEGGPCWWINPFTKALLEQFGYRAYHICGSNPGFEIYDSHISTIVEGAAYPGSLHLVDPGTRRPLCAAIPLNFEKESPVYKFHFMRSKFFRKGDQLIWCSETSTIKPGDDYTLCDSSGKVWKQELLYHLKEKRNWFPYVKITQEFTKIVENALPPPFNGLVFFAYSTKERIFSVFQKRIHTYVYEQDDSFRKSAMSKPALLQLFRENFPQYSERKLREVFKICEIY